MRRDLAAAAARGVDVRVLLDAHLEKSRNKTAYDYLTARHVHVAWAPAATTYHQKTLTVDGKQAARRGVDVMVVMISDSEWDSATANAAVVSAISATLAGDYAPPRRTPHMPAMMRLGPHMSVHVLSRAMVGMIVA